MDRQRGAGAVGAGKIGVAKRMVAHLLFLLTRRDYNLRARRLRPDRPYWGDVLLSHLGYTMTGYHPEWGYKRRER